VDILLRNRTVGSKQGTEPSYPFGFRKDCGDLFIRERLDGTRNLSDSEGSFVTILWQRAHVELSAPFDERLEIGPEVTDAGEAPALSFDLLPEPNVVALELQDVQRPRIRRTLLNRPGLA
jgi:hypothetical protein